MQALCAGCLKVMQPRSARRYVQASEGSWLAGTAAVLQLLQYLAGSARCQIIPKDPPGGLARAPAKVVWAELISVDWLCRS